MVIKNNIFELFCRRLGLKSYGPSLKMLHHQDVSVLDWYKSFEDNIQSNIGAKYFPVYRMADGEFILMFGFRWNWRHTNPLWSLASFMKYQFIWYFGKGFQTSWGEIYSLDEIEAIRKFYREGITEVLENGMVCPFIYETGNRQYESHKWEAFRFFSELGGGTMSERVIPFHFPFFLMSNSVGDKPHVLEGRRVLVVSGLDEGEQGEVRKSLQLIGAARVSFLPISRSKSMFDKLPTDSSSRFKDCEIALVAAGIGSLNVIRQMSWFSGPVIDVGGFMRCLKERGFIYHGGACRFPELN